MKLRQTALILLGIAFLGSSGCGGRRKEVTELQRKEAAHLASEAQFAMNLRDWARAESVMTKVVEVCPDAGPYWVSLGSLRVRIDKRGPARDAYKSALQAYEDEAKKNPKDVEPWLQQVYVLALMGRVDDSRKLLEKMAKRFPESRDVRAFIEGKQFEAMLADPTFKQMAL
ncbi:MAG: hypothetical protein Q7S40_14940 [Opitutaceae bacterium]|nr:hypothetical protein [Opitutaceae bacterium]